MSTDTDTTRDVAPDAAEDTTEVRPVTRLPRRRRLMSWGAAAVLAAGLVAGTVAVADPFAPPALDSVGHIDGSAALVAVVAQDDQVVAYVCDGPAGLGERFAGTADGDHADLHSPRGATLSVDLRDGASEGTFTAAGEAPKHFSTVPATGSAGWYAAQGATATGTFTAGWVELADGTQTGSLRRTSSESGGSGDSDTAGGSRAGDGGAGGPSGTARDQRGGSDRGGDTRAGQDRSRADGATVHPGGGRGGHAENAPRLHHRPPRQPANGNPGVVGPEAQPPSDGGLEPFPGGPVLVPPVTRGPGQLVDNPLDLRPVPEDQGLVVGPRVPRDPRLLGDNPPDVQGAPSGIDPIQRGPGAAQGGPQELLNVVDVPGVGRVAVDRVDTGDLTRIIRTP